MVAVVLGAMAGQMEKTSEKLYSNKSHDKLVRKKNTVQTTETFVAGTKSNFIDTNMTVNKFNITKKQVSYVIRYVQLTSSHKNTY